MCTHVIQGSASPTLRRLGILDDLMSAGARESGVNVWSRYGWISPDRAYMDRIDEDGVGLNIRRQVLDPMLRRMAAETDGVELMMGQTATSLLRDGERVAGVIARSQRRRRSASCAARSWSAPTAASRGSRSWPA